MGGKEAKKKSLFNEPLNKPTAEQRKQMIALALEIGIKAVMKNHIYRFNDQIYLQKEGGPIGLELTGAIARVFMIWWDTQFLEKIKNIRTNWNLHFYMRYIDDTNMIGDIMTPGMRYEGGRLVTITDKEEEDKKVPDDVRTAKVVQEIANSICDFIEVEIDCPSMHVNKWLPILDLEVQVVKDTVVYRFYRKEMPNFRVIMADSAMPHKTKKTCLIQEVIRILRNTSRKLDPSVARYYLSEFSLRMKESGYEEKMRLEVIKRGMEGYEKQIARDESGECPLYRPKGYKQEERQRKKVRSKVSWYKPYDTIMFCPPTPKSELAEKFRNIIEKGKEEGRSSVKVVEKAGRKIGSILPGLRERENCGREECLVHSMGGRGNCRKEGIVYRGKCVTCSEEGIQSVYIGESGRSAFVRGQQHLKAIRNRTESNAFAKHNKESHNNRRDTKFKIDVLKTYRKPLERQIREGIEILHTIDQADNVLNSKLDHYQPAIRRITFDNILEELQELQEA